ncbi:hypothetical protein REPUB_Repub17cG0129800 [Reevesia pubescens]
MKRDGLRVAFEAWNFCNEVAYETPGMGSPRAADCFDVANSTLIHKVSWEDNRLGIGKSFKRLSPDTLHHPDLYAVENELYLGSLCEVPNPKPWQFWMVVWEKKLGSGGWVFKHKLKTFEKYNWLMLYLRADATKRFSGRYHYETRGMMHTNNGKPCDGDVLTDVTRYNEMIINLDTPDWCSPKGLVNCPQYHITPDNKKIYRNDTANFPYGVYHYYCAHGNAKFLEQPVSICDPYSNPQGQEIVQLLPHPIWGAYGYPTKKGQGWEGDLRTWVLDTDGLASKLYFYQDPGTPPAKRVWTSIDMGT